jgi:hypothetical protein
MRRTTLLVVAGLSALSLVGVPPADAQQREPSPGPGWVFDGKGQKTDRPALVDMGFNDSLFPINVNNHWGLMNQDGEVVIFPRFDWTDYSYEGFTRFVTGGKTGFLRGDVSDDTDPNEYQIPARFDYADRFFNGLSVVMIDGRWGVIDKTGETLLPLEFDGVLRFQDGFAAVQRGERCGFINRAGDLKIPFEYKAVRSFHNGFAAVQRPDGRWAYIDKRGKTVWLDETGRVKLLGDFHQEYARVQVTLRDGVVRWGYLTKAFKFRIDPVFEDARDFHNGIAAVKKDGKWGFIFANGRWLIEPQFDDADDFDDAVGSGDFEDAEREREERAGRDLSTGGLYAMVKLDGRWGYVNRGANGGLVPQFKAAQPFFRGLARVDRDESFAYVSEIGQVRFDPRVALDFGFVDRTGREQGRLRNNLGTQDQPGNQIVPPPPPRKQAEVPYVPEHLYVEMLPVPER